jgi:hypothetical protein
MDDFLTWFDCFRVKRDAFSVQSASSRDFRNRLNAMMEEDSQSFRGMDLANLIREKYGKSYDAIFIQKVGFLLQHFLATPVQTAYHVATHVLV